MSDYRPAARVHEARDALAAIERCYAEGWTDGLPVVPPTSQLVAAAVAASGRAPDEVVARIAPREAEATVEKVAINAVMAGCLPEYLPVVIAAVEAVADPVFNLNGVQACTDVAGILLVVHGSIAKQLGVNAAGNVLGQGFRANATIGRALRLVLMNLGGGIPQQTDMSTLGQPGKLSYCMAENEPESPWEPLHVERGFAASESAVTVFAAEAPHAIGDFVSSTPEGLLDTIADSLTTLGSMTLYFGGELFLVLCPQHAAVFAEAGWSKADVRRHFFEIARKPATEITRFGLDRQVPAHYWPVGTDWSSNGSVALLRRPEDLVILVAGGRAGRFSAGIPGWGYRDARSVTRRVSSRPEDNRA
ncbi:MAG: hypothetical protein HY329_08575 [Chloroflexi bacterium]|nr:hypothetical protein [Chloroflexota bacterium]